MSTRRPLVIVNGVIVERQTGDTISTGDAKVDAGLFGNFIESSNTGSIVAGTTGADLIYDFSSACSLTLSVGTWLLMGSLTARTNDVDDEIFAGFRDVTNNVDFGKGSSVKTAGLDTLFPLPAFGYLVVVSGTPVIRLKAFRYLSSTLELGTVNGISGAMRGIKLFG